MAKIAKERFYNNFCFSCARNLNVPKERHVEIEMSLGAMKRVIRTLEKNIEKLKSGDSISIKGKKDLRIKFYIK